MEECIVCFDEADHVTRGVCHTCACEIQQQSERDEERYRCRICFDYSEDTAHGKCPSCRSTGRASPDYFRVMLKLPDLLVRLEKERGIRAPILNKDREEFRRTGKAALTLDDPARFDEAASFLMGAGLWIELDTGRIVVIPDQPIPKSALIGLAQQSS